MTAMPCPEIPQLQAFLQGKIAAQESHTIRRHLSECRACSALVDSLIQNTADTNPLGPRSRRPSNDKSELDFLTPVPPQASAPVSYSFLRPAVEPDEIGRLGEYRILRLLCRGGMGMVFLAEDVALHRRVAIKVIKQDLDADCKPWERFLREARILAAIKHEHVVTVYQAGQDGGVAYLVMELLEGRSLHHHLESVGKLSLAEIIRLGREIAAGLEVVHRHGLIHRDIKPANIWLEAPHGRVKLLDFGLARLVDDDSQLTQPGIAMGTPAFMSPEQARGQRVDERTDLFSLGCILYRLCTGAEPFPGPDTLARMTALALKEPRPIAEMNPAIPDALADLVMQLLAKSTEDRPATAGEVIMRLERLEQSPDNAAPATRGDTRPMTKASKGTRKRKKAERGSGRLRWVILGVLVLLLGIGMLAGLGAIGLAFAFYGRPQPPTDSEYLSEWQPVASTGMPKGPMPGGRDKGPPLMHGEPPPVGFPVISVHGKRSAHGIGMHASPMGLISQTYSLGKRYDFFSTDVSLNDSSQQSPVPLTFVVYGDGKLLWESKPVTTRDDTQSCRVSVKNVDRLELAVTCPQDEPHALMGAHSIWIEPRVTQGK